MTSETGQWFILRMSSASTLNVHDKLHKAGFEVWTPVERKHGRKPKSRSRFEKKAPMMPSYVFAHVRHLDDILRMSMIPTLDCPKFTMFRYQGGFPLIAEAELQSLRHLEERCSHAFEKARLKTLKPPVFSTGQVIDMPEGGFSGLTGTVIESKGNMTLVDVPGFNKPIRIASVLLVDKQEAA